MLRTEREFSRALLALKYRCGEKIRMLGLRASHLALCFMFGALLALIACAGNNTSQRNSTFSSAAPPTAAMLPEYRIGILDELEIRVQFHERLNEMAKVRPDGRITLQEIGEIYVLGLTATEVDRLISDAFAKNVHAPEVTVFVRNFANRSIYVLGEVGKPGRIDLVPNMSVLQALAAAGGSVRGAKLNSVIVLRPTSNGQLSAMRLDLNRKAIQNGQAQDQILLPQDLIYVPKTTIANINEFLTQIYDGLFPPFDIYFRALREYNRN